MATVMDGGAQGRMDIGRVFSRAFGAIGRNWVLFIGVAVGFAILNKLVGFALAKSIVSSTAGNPLAVFRSPGYWATLLWSVISGFIFYAMMVHATVVDLGGTRPQFGPVFGFALGRVLPLIGLAVITYFAVVFASFLFLIPGLMLLVRWSVSVPALVEERRGVFDSLKRSNALSRGSRWRIFALGLIILVISAVPGVLSLTAVGLSANAVQSMTSFSPLLIFAGLLSAIASLFVVAILAALYVELRSIHDGVAPDRLAEMFA